MQTIYKYQLDKVGEQVIQMPKGAKILSCGIQDTFLFVWAVVDSDAPDADYYIDIFGTGHPYRCKGGRHEFIGTALDDPYVWHVFQRVSAA